MSEWPGLLFLICLLNFSFQIAEVSGQFDSYCFVSHLFFSPSRFERFFSSFKFWNFTCVWERVWLCLGLDFILFFLIYLVWWVSSAYLKTCFSSAQEYMLLLFHWMFYPSLFFPSESLIDNLYVYILGDMFWKDTLTGYFMSSSFYVLVFLTRNWDFSMISLNVFSFPKS